MKISHTILELQTTSSLWLFQLDDSESLRGKWLFNQTAIKNWLFRVPGCQTLFPDETIDGLQSPQESFFRRSPERTTFLENNFGVKIRSHNNKFTPEN